MGNMVKKMAGKELFLIPVSTDAPRVADRVATKNRGTARASRTTRLFLGRSR